MNAKLIQKLKKEKKLVSVKGINLPISRKKSVNIAKYIQYLPLKKAEEILKKVIKQEIAIPFYKYNRDIPHRKNIDEKIKHGRYPVKPARYILKLLESLEKNAINLGLDPSKIFLAYIIVSKGNTMPAKMNRDGRIVRRKSTNIEIYGVYVEEYDPAKKYKKKELKAFAKKILREWLQKI